MATAKRKTVKKKPKRRWVPSGLSPLVTSRLDHLRDALSRDQEVILVTRSGERKELRIAPADIKSSSEVGRFGFLEYHRPGDVSLYRLFVDGEDAGIERKNLSALLVEAASMTSVLLSDPERPGMAAAACRVLNLYNA